MVERDQVMVPAGWDSIGKIKVLRNGFDCEGVADGWDKDAKGTGEGEAADGPLVEGARKVYEETIVNPKRSHAVSRLIKNKQAEQGLLLISSEDDH